MVRKEDAEKDQKILARRGTAGEHTPKQAICESGARSGPAEKGEMIITGRRAYGERGPRYMDFKERS